MRIEEFIETPFVKSYKDYIIEYNGEHFRAITTNKEHIIYNKLGNRIVYDWNGKLQVSVEKLKQVLDWSKDGINYCRQCLERIDNEEYEQYFAKIFCKKCWTPKLQEDRAWDYAHLD